MAPTSPNPNTHATSTSPEYNHAEKELLDIARVDAWRTHQHGVLNGLREADPDFMSGAYITLFNDNVDDSLDEYLEQQGVGKTAPNYARVRTMYRDASIDRVRDEQWYTSPAARGEDPSDTTSGRDKVITLFKSEVDTSTAPEEDLDGTETETTGERLESARKAKQEAFTAFLKGPRFGKRHKANKEAYDEAEKAYMEALLTKNAQDLAKKKAQYEEMGLDDAVVARELRKFAKDEAEKRNVEDQEAQRQLFIEKSGRMGRFLDWYANKKTWQKVAIGIGAGAATFGLGFGLGFMTGGIGAIVGAASLAGLRGSNVWRAYQMRKAELFKKPPTYEQMTIADDANVDELHLRQREFLEKSSRNHIKQAEKIKKNNVAWTLGSVALLGSGGVVGIVGHAVFVDHWNPLGKPLLQNIPKHTPGGQVQHWLEGEQQGTGSGSGSGADTSKGPWMGDFRKDIEPGPGHLETPHIDNSLYVDNGHGLIRETYESATAAGYKIDSKTAEQLYEAVREKFGDNGIIDIQDVAKDTYLHGNDLRLSAPGKAVWKDGVTDFMQKWLEEHGHSVSGVSGTSGVAEAASASSGIPEVSGMSVGDTMGVTEQAINRGSELQMNVVDAKEGWFQTFRELRDAGVVNIPGGEYGNFLKSAWPDLKDLTYSDGTPVAYLTRTGKVGMYLSPDNGQLLPEAIRVLVRRAAEQGYTFSGTYATRAAQVSLGIPRAA